MTTIKLSTIDLIDKGNVPEITQHPIVEYGREKIVGGEVLIPGKGPAETLYMLTGYLDSDDKATVAQQLRNLYHSQKPVWLETDFLPSKFAFVKASDFEAPFRGGEKVIRYSLELTEVTGWGRAYIHTADDAYLADIDGNKLVEDIYSPLWGRFNFNLDRLNLKFSEELIIINKDEETSSANEITDDSQASFWSTITLDATISNDTNLKKKGSDCLRIQIVLSDTYSGVYEATADRDWSNYEFLCFWWHGQNSGSTIRFRAKTTNWSNYFEYVFTDNWTGWRRIVVPLENMTATGSPDWGNIDEIRFMIYGTGTWYLDRVVLDVGSWVYVELQHPDNMGNYTTTHHTLESMYGGEYYKFLEWDNLNYAVLNNCYLMNGTKLGDAYGSTVVECYPEGEAGDSVSRIVGNGSSSLTVSQKYGCLKRVIFGVKLPPWSSIDIHKVHLRYTGKFVDETTSYIDGSD